MLYGFGRRGPPTPSLPSSVTEALTVFCNLFYGEARPTSERGRPTEHEVNVGLALLRRCAEGQEPAFDSMGFQCEEGRC